MRGLLRCSEDKCSNDAFVFCKNISCLKRILCMTCLPKHNLNHLADYILLKDLIPGKGHDNYIQLKVTHFEEKINEMNSMPEELTVTIRHTIDRIYSTLEEEVLKIVRNSKDRLLKRLNPSDSFNTLLATAKSFNAEFEQKQNNLNECNTEFKLDQLTLLLDNFRKGCEVEINKSMNDLSLISSLRSRCETLANLDVCKNCTNCFGDLSKSIDEKVLMILTCGGQANDCPTTNNDRTKKDFVLRQNDSFRVKTPDIPSSIEHLDKVETQLIRTGVVNHETIEYMGFKYNLLNQRNV
eukprot:TRINITY_DN6488_c0_g1_i2.p1 TRINITY_DN6488_c0_g1~~TRINITY_DN6488_c0_g1_i2.p1  ORF type:complete len:296 (+),score=37.26 TRINITY_DN6488_c0_g1_i2:131-1018(+)